MSAPIKPPSGPRSLPETGAAPPSGSAEGSFQKTIEERSVEDAAALSAAAAKKPGVTPDVIREVTAELRAGAIDAAQVVERILGRTLESPAARALTPAGRADLEAFLRRALEDDPGLRAIVKDLERGR